MPLSKLIPKMQMSLPRSFDKFKTNYFKNSASSLALKCAANKIAKIGQNSLRSL